MQARLSEITGQTTAINQQINKASMETNIDIENLFKKAATDLKLYQDTKNAKSQQSVWGRITGKQTEQQVKFKSYQDSINSLFDVISLELKNTEKVGKKFQEMRKTVKEQLPILIELKTESDTELAQYENQVEIPLGTLKLNSQITAEVSRLEARLTRLEAGIMTTQGTVMDLAGQLPTIKAGIEDETAFGLELDDMTNVYGRVREAKEILTNVADANAKALEAKVIGILDEQISDKSMITYVRKADDNTNSLAENVAQRAEDLSNKLLEESTEIRERFHNSLAAPTRIKLEKLNH